MTTFFKQIIRSLVILAFAVLLSAGVLLATGTRSASAQNARAGHSHVRGNNINLAGAGEVGAHFAQVGLVTAVGAGIIAFTKRNKHVSRVSTARDQIANQVNHG